MGEHHLLHQGSPTRLFHQFSTSVSQQYHQTASANWPRSTNQCLECHKTFGTKRDLDRHIRVHTGEKPFKCTICAYASSRKDHLRKHKIKVHGWESVVVVQDVKNSTV